MTEQNQPLTDDELVVDEYLTQPPAGDADGGDADGTDGRDGDGTDGGDADGTDA